MPFDVRARVIAAFIASNDKSLPALFKQLIQSQSPTVRQLAALGCGAIRDNKLVDSLIDLLVDHNLEVRLASCLAFTILELMSSPVRVVEVLEHGDEELRRTIAETLAFGGPTEHEILSLAVESEDILTRRAAVFGLALVQRKWALELFSGSVDRILCAQYGVTCSKPG